MKIFLGADHRGFKMKKEIIDWFNTKKYDVEDMGATEFDKNDDYPTFASRVASMVADNKESLGILFCGSGVGVDIVANKFDGVRASIGKEPKQVAAGRRDDDMNILVIASDFTETSEAKSMIEFFLKTKFSADKRHKRRLSQISHIESNN